MPTPDQIVTHGSDPTLGVSALDREDDAWFARLRDPGGPAHPGRLGPYELLGEVARGGQGIVFKARQPRTGREIAIKRLSAGAFATPQMRARFEREVEAASTLDHPNIVTVYGSEVIDGQPLLAMQWIDGLPFDQWSAECGVRSAEWKAATTPKFSRDSERSATPEFTAKARNHEGTERGRRGVREVLEVFLQVCDAVHHAHQRGVIHRDLKPSNILVACGEEGTKVRATKEGARTSHEATKMKEAEPSVAPSLRGSVASAKVLDFGLAKLAEPGSEIQNLKSKIQNLTMTGQFVGTPAYAAPEQICGDQSQVDVRTDVYALGAVLYQGLTGRTLFEHSGTLAELVETVRKREPKPPSALDPRLNREIDAIVLKAVAKEKDQRYPSVDALGADVRRYLAGLAVLAHPPSTAYRVRKFVRHHRGMVAGATAFVVLLVAATVVSTTYYFRADTALRQETEQRLRAEQQETKARHEADKQAAVFQILKDIISGADRARQGGNADVRIRDALDTFVEKLRAGEKDYLPEIDAAVRKSIADTYNSLGLFGQAATLFSEVIAILREIDGVERELADALTGLASAQRRIQKAEEAEKALRESLSIYERLPGRRDGIAAVLNELSILVKAQCRRPEAVELCRRALTIRRELYGERSDLAATTLNNLSLIVEEPRPSIELLEEALDIRRELPGDQQAEIAVILGNLGLFQRRASDFLAAKRSYDEAYEVLRRLYGEDHHNTLIVNNNRSRVYFELGDLDESERILREVLAWRRKIYGNDSDYVAGTLNNLGSLLRQKGQPAEALQYLQESLEIVRKLSGPDSGAAIEREANVASTLENLGQFDEAERLYRKTLEWRRTHLADHAATAGNLHMLGQLLASRGQQAEAEAMLIESVAMSRKALGSDHLDLGIHLGSLAAFYDHQGRAAEAESIFREALAIHRKRLPAGHPRTLGVQTRLASVLAALGQFDDASELLTEVENLLRLDPSATPAQLRESIEKFVALYEAWEAVEPEGGHETQTEQWRQRLAECEGDSTTADEGRAQ